MIDDPCPRRDQMNELAAEDAIFSCDVGTPTIWAARYLTMNGRRRRLGLEKLRGRGMECAERSRSRA